MHFALFHEGIIPLVKFKELLSLLSSTNVNLTIQSTLKNGTEISESMLHILDIDHPRGEIFEVMHYQLLLIRNKNCNSVLLRK